MVKSKYIYDQFKDSASYKKILIEFLKHSTNAEVGGYRNYSGAKDHLTQNPYEIADLIFFLKNYELKNKFYFNKFLEIGFSAGITNTLLNKFFKFKKIVGIDSFKYGISGDVLISNLRFKNLVLLCSDTNDTNTIDNARAMSPYDLIFIDANHTYEGIKNDFKNYSPLIAKKGIIILHDIMNPEWTGVRKLWDEIEKTKKYKMKKIFSNGFPIKYGIGLIIKK